MTLAWPAMRRRLWSVILALFTILPASQALAEIPANAKTTNWGQGWQCEPSFRKRGTSCEKLDVPENASLDYSGRAWRCNRGFERHGSECMEIALPAHAVLDHAGNDWKCEHRFRRQGNQCTEIKVPEHATLSYTGDGWDCEHGYRRSGSSCTKIAIPEHSSLSYDGKSWSCNAGFLKHKGSCVNFAQATDAEIRQHMIDESVASYPGNCPCPYFADRAGRSCGARSAYSRPGGYSPLCYPTDISFADVKIFRNSRTR